MSKRLLLGLGPFQRMTCASVSTRPSWALWASNPFSRFSPARGQRSRRYQKLDAELRLILREEVFPEFVEIEFERVMKAVFSEIA